MPLFTGRVSYLKLICVCIPQITRQLWPYAGHYVHDLCKFTIEPSIRQALEEYKLSGFKFEKIILGDTPFRLSGVKVYDDTSRHEIIMDMDFAWVFVDVIYNLTPLLRMLVPKYDNSTPYRDGSDPCKTYRLDIKMCKT